MLPGFILWFAGVGIAYFFVPKDGYSTEDVWRLSIGFGLILGLVLSMVFAYLKAVWQYHAHKYLLTDKRIIIKTGLLTVHLTGVLFDKITHLEVDQSWFDRLVMKHGDIIINTAGMHKDELRLDYIDYPIEFKGLMEKLISRTQRQHGLEPDPVFAVDGEVVDSKREKRRSGKRWFNI
jgi:uncharacterized membrane protein YdbT with pleckstrin-like domain